MYNNRYNPNHSHTQCSAFPNTAPRQTSFPSSSTAHSTASYTQSQQYRSNGLHYNPYYHTGSNSNSTPVPCPWFLPGYEHIFNVVTNTGSSSVFQQKIYSFNQAAKHNSSKEIKISFKSSNWQSVSVDSLEKIWDIRFALISYVLTSTSLYTLTIYTSI